VAGLLARLRRDFLGEVDDALRVHGVYTITRKVHILRWLRGRMLGPAPPLER